MDPSPTLSGRVLENTASVSRRAEERKDRPLESLGSGGSCWGGEEPMTSQTERPERWEPEMATRGHPRPAVGSGSLHKTWKVRGVVWETGVFS